jgi:phosphocarrier protein HPr
MPSGTFIITNPHGLHARPAVLFVQAAVRHGAAIRVRKSDRIADGKSVLGLLTLGLKYNDVVTLEVDVGDPELISRLGELLGAQVAEEPPQQAGQTDWGADASSPR